MSAAAEVCSLPAEGLDYISGPSRLDCLKKARFLLPQPEVNAQTVVLQTRRDIPDDSWQNFNPQENLRCRYRQEDWGGSSPKFYCLRSNAEGVLYSSKKMLDSNGRDVPVLGAVAANDNDELLNASGETLRTDKGKTIKGDEIKVKYFRPQSYSLSNGQTEVGVPKREREVFTEVAVARIFWALGIPADRMLPVPAVTCDGCTQDPYERQAEIAKRGSQLVQSRFTLTTVERKIEGKRLEPIAGRNSSNGNKYGFFRNEVAKPGFRAEQTVEMEVFGLAASVVGLYNFANFQNRLFCPDQVELENGEVVNGADKNSGECLYPIAMVQDIGAAFGGRRASEREVHNPRGEYAVFNRRAVFSNKNRCELNVDLGGRSQVSEAARLIFVDRVRALKPHIRRILELARFHIMDSEFRQQVNRDLNSNIRSEALDEHILAAWTTKVLANIESIETARCPQ